MALRDYQSKFVEAVLSRWSEFNRLLGVAPTGAGKTIMAAELIKQLLQQPPHNGGAGILFLADAKELVKQGAGKIQKWCDLPFGCMGIEQGDSKALLGDV